MRQVRVYTIHPSFIWTISSFNRNCICPIPAEAWHKHQIRVIIGLNDSQLVDSLNSKASTGSKTRYWHFPDVEGRGAFPGDYRMALLPFQAAKDLGYNFKWMLYGDDDTIWHLSNVQKLLAPFNHSLPYALSDFLLWRDVMGPSIIAPRCLPCHWNTTLNISLGFDWPLKGGCEKGCTPDLACGPRTYEIDKNFPAIGLINGSTIPMNQRECFERGIGTSCPLECTRNAAGTIGPLVAYGGAGYIFSVELLKQFPPERARYYYDRKVCNGCDCYISKMLWNASVAITDPGYGFTTMAHKHDVLRRRLFSDVRFDSIMRSAGDGRCLMDPDCLWYLQYPVSQHLFARRFSETHTKHPLHWIEGATNWTRHVLGTLDKIKRDLETKGLLDATRRNRWKK